MKTLIASLAALLMSAAPALVSRVDYRFDEVKRHVTLRTPDHDVSATKGGSAKSGDKVSTGLFSYALIAADQYKAKFEVFGSTDVQLAGGTAGVIVSLERGKLHAIFDKLTGTEPRIVQTPGALLAVRGTQYTVEVDRAGSTTLDVFEGTVEVRSDLRHEPLFVRAGEESVFSRREPPSSPRPMPQERRRDGGERGATGENDPRGGRDGAGQPGQHGGPGHSGPGGGPQSAPPPKPPGGRP